MRVPQIQLHQILRVCFRIFVQLSSPHAVMLGVPGAVDSELEPEEDPSDGELSLGRSRSDWMAHNWRGKWSLPLAMTGWPSRTLCKHLRRLRGAPPPTQTYTNINVSIIIQIAHRLRV